ncbi:uncharacterized protein DSM5745_04339 [Aspergillus mulundensis]|uniref:Uncharacterized protein n=1 Tax=Aspergillus mulundensis TaxID=1810919 RepID=A0A3D8SCK8_9EURO|nr:hypothetical protein DSM5745_04339 [Aspergillus mulundensis]RDW84013.1 hypothetical protein DSM5745_04339 [Aspergillus mulundensis]
METTTLGILRSPFSSALSATTQSRFHCLAVTRHTTRWEPYVKLSNSIGTWTDCWEKDQGILANDYAEEVECNHYSTRKFHDIVEDLRASGQATGIPRRNMPPDPEWYIGDLDKGDLLYALWLNSIPFHPRVQFNREEALRQAERDKWHVWVVQAGRSGLGLGRYGVCFPMGIQ